MSDSINHPWDIRCPYCVNSDFNDVLDQDKAAEKDRERVEKARGKIKGTDTVVSVPEDHRQDMQELPPWVNPKIQPPQVQKNLGRFKTRGQQPRDS